MMYVYEAIFSPEEAGGYSVIIPDIPGCFTFGGSLAESVKNASEAIALNIEDYIASSENIPQATFGHPVEDGDSIFPVAAKIDPEQVSVGEPYMTTAEVGKLLGVSDSRIRQLYGEGALVGKKPGRDLQIARWSVDEYRKEQSLSTSVPEALLAQA